MTRCTINSTSQALLILATWTEKLKSSSPQTTKIISLQMDVPRSVCILLLAVDSEIFILVTGVYDTLHTTSVNNQTLHLCHMHNCTF
jgi:hypothetical protein